MTSNDSIETTSANKPPHRSRLRRVVRWALATIYVFIAGELFLRAMSPVALFPRRVVATSYGIRGNKPNDSYKHTSAEVNINMRINSKGVRADREIPYEKPAGVKRIVALGDSFGMGYEVALEDMFLSHLERQLTARGIPTEVINLSVSGHGNAEELIALREEGLKYSPDLVLVCWHASDLDDNVRSGLYAMRDGKLAQKAKTYLPAVGVREQLEKFPPYRWLEESSMLYSFLRENLAGYVKGMKLALEGGDESDEASGGTQEAKKGGPKSRPKWGPQQRLAIALLHEIESTAQANNAKLLVLDIPDKLTGDRFRSGFPIDPEGNDFGLQVVSPIPAFQNLRDVKLYHERSANHLTPAATRVVGQLLADVIIAKHLL